ncbi:MAG: tetratricopeptide repeat protein [Planctomycetaceae bacterium]|nr:tetratricopeptide repeat protein [Planctomycetaceae bacterium]
MSSHLVRARLLLSQRNPLEALKEIRLHLAEEPQDGIGHGLHAEALCILEEYEDALDAAEQALAYAPDSGFSHYVQSRALLGFDEKKATKAALAAIQEAIRLEPDEEHYHCQEAFIHEKNSNWQKMLEATQRALELNPEDDLATNLQAIALKRLRKGTAASGAIEAAMKRNPDDPVTHANQGWLLLEQKQHLKALEHFREALRLDPEMDWARLGIVEALKARNFIYRAMLSFFFWMANFSPRTRWFIILGAWGGINLLSASEESLGKLSVVVTPLVMTYFGFVLMTWIAIPLFNFILRFDSYGRLALDRRQTRQANWLAITFAGALVYLVVFLMYRHLELTGDVLFESVMWSLALAIPVTTCFEVRKGRPRNGMALYSCGLALLIAYWTFLGGYQLPKDIDQLSQFEIDLRKQGIVIDARNVQNFQLRKSNGEQLPAADLEPLKEKVEQKIAGITSISQRFRRMGTMLQFGFLAACFAPSFLPRHRERNEIDVHIE